MGRKSIAAPNANEKRNWQRFVIIEKPPRNGWQKLQRILAIY